MVIIKNKKEIKKVNNMEEKTEKKRPDWQEYFLNIAEVVSTRSSCMRSKCGAVIVKGKSIISTGYNGSPTYQQNCQEIGNCYRNDKGIESGTQLEKCRACGSHSESNAIALAARNNGGCDGATIYIYGNKAICTQCRGIIANAGIKKVVYRNVEGKITTEYPETQWKIHPLDKSACDSCAIGEDCDNEQYHTVNGCDMWIEIGDKPIESSEEIEWKHVLTPKQIESMSGCCPNCDDPLQFGEWDGDDIIVNCTNCHYGKRVDPEGNEEDLD